jgi:hypothetical protein
VDFTNRSDGEVLAWLADANKKVCGRFDADQLNRRLVPLPERKRRAWVIWQFVLAGLLISSRASAQKAPGVRVVQCDKKLLGEPMMGKVAVRPDSSRADTPRYTNLPPVVVQGYSTRKQSDIMEDVVTVASRKATRVVKDWLKDTLAIVGIPKKEKELTLYPNPVVRGAAVRYTLPSTLSGEGELELFNSGGALVLEKWINNAETGTLNIPSSLPAGIYLLRLSPARAGKAYTQQLVVL